MAPTDGLRLLHGTGDERVDEILRGTIALFEAAAPGRVAGYYLAGSYAEGTADSTSDIDLFYDLRVPPEALSPEEARRCLAVAESVDRISSIEIHPALAHAPVDWGAVRHGVLLYGEDRRREMPSPTADEVLRWLYARPPRQGLLPEAAAPVRYPLAYPDSADEFFGYPRRDVRTRDGRVHEGTHGLVGLVTGLATARVAAEAGLVVPRKSSCVALYREHIGDEWTELIADAYEWCRNRWEYLIPHAPAERHRLRELCRRTLHLENAGLLVRHRYLQRLAGSGGAGERAFATEAQRLVSLPLGTEWGHPPPGA
jgi:predicted nucleotidyltransferase